MLVSSSTDCGEPQIYHHSPFVHCLMAFLVAFVFGFIAYNGWLEPLEYLAIGPLVAVALWLYIRSGFTEWVVTPEALLLKRPYGVKTLPWHMIKRIRHLWLVQTVQILDEDGVVAFNSNDLFPGVRELMAEISTRSGASMPRTLRPKRKSVAN
jgi:hypothetical protein